MKSILPTQFSLKILQVSVPCLCVAAFFLSTPFATAANFVWTGAEDEFWGEDGNWNLAGFPQVGDTATINLGTAVDLGGPQAADRLTLGSGSSLINNSSGALTVGAGISGASTPIVSLSGNGTTISAPITFGAASANNSALFGATGTSSNTITISGPVNIGAQNTNNPRLIQMDAAQAAHVVFSGNITGAVTSSTALAIQPGNGTVTLSGNNSFTTGSNNFDTNIIGTGGENTTGTLYLSHSSALGNAGHTLRVAINNNQGTLAAERYMRTLIDTPGVTISNAVRVGQGATNEIGGSNTSGTATWSGEFTMVRNANSDDVSKLPVQLSAAAGGTVVFSNNFTAAGGGGRLPDIEKVGLGTVLLSRSAGLTYTEDVTVKAGTLLVTNASGTGTGGGTVTVESGAILGGTGRIAPTGADTLTIESGGFLLGGMGSAAAGALEISGDVNFESGSTIRLVLGPGFETSSITRQGGTWTFDTNQQFDFTVLSGADFGTYENLITGLAVDPGVSLWTVTTPGFGESFFNYDNGSIHLALIPEPSAALLLLLGVAMVVFRRRMLARKLS